MIRRSLSPDIILRSISDLPVWSWVNLEDIQWNSRARIVHFSICHLPRLLTDLAPRIACVSLLFLFRAVGDDLEDPKLCVIHLWVTPGGSSPRANRLSLMRMIYVKNAGIWGVSARGCPYREGSFGNTGCFQVGMKTGIFSKFQWKHFVGFLHPSKKSPRRRLYPGYKS